MTTEDAERWDERWAAAPSVEPAPPSDLSAVVDLLPATGRGLEIACGTGSTAVWLAGRGLSVEALDVSPVAIESARSLAERHGVSDGCRFEVVDLDDGLPEGDSVDVIICQRFRDTSLYAAMIERLVPGGVLAISVLSEVGAEAGAFRAPAGELEQAFRSLDVVASGEGDGLAWLIARRP